MYIDGGSFKVQVPSHKAEALYDYLGKQVVFGIRPESIHDPEYAPPGILGAPVQANVDVTELMGNEVFLYLLTGSKSFIARVDPRTSARVGQTVEVLFDMENMQIFDRDTETAVR
jgi:multiple sugar transport system ATP-binding protein